MKPQQVGFLLAICAFAFLLSLVSPSVHAKVTGPCANCHTMHNSQGGSDLLSEPKPVLLVDDCLGCHSASDSSTWKDDVTGAPIVYNTNAPQYGYFDGQYYHGLAGGNFYWVKTDDSKGHNVFPGEGDDILSTAPGLFIVSCGNTACHANLHLAYNVEVSDEIGLFGRQGCAGCHMLDDLIQSKGFHHANDGGPGDVIRDFPWYRFLKGHNVANDEGVSGIEDSDWEVTSDASHHNEYLGMEQAGGNTSPRWPLSTHTVTAFCSGCHGNFHVQKSSETWVRHPSDAKIPDSGEYAAYTTYNPEVPVARPALSDGVISATVTPGDDLVMCLSCHRPHGSPYSDMLRWNYDDMEVGSGGAGGCFRCHTQKN